jgi:hypothetical protein
MGSSSCAGALMDIPYAWLIILNLG